MARLRGERRLSVTEPPGVRKRRAAKRVSVLGECTEHYEVDGVASLTRGSAASGRSVESDVCALICERGTGWRVRRWRPTLHRHTLQKRTGLPRGVSDDDEDVVCSR